jgi:uncharacterized protein (TIGR03435 family)
MAIVFFLIAPTQLRAQSQSQTTAVATPVYEYDVTSIKPAQPGNGGGRGRGGRGQAPDAFTVSNVTMEGMIQQAYGVRLDQISGAPSWLNSERYDVDAKMDSSVADALLKLSPDDVTLARQKMLQALLADRLKLTIRRETKEMPIYSLVVAKNGPKLQAPTGVVTLPDGTKRAIGPNANGALYIMQLNPGEDTLMGFAVPMPAFTRLLTLQVGRPVVDKTGLTGKYDLNMKWEEDENGPLARMANSDAGASAVPATDPVGGSLFTAIQEQLGLKLEPGKGPVEIIVIDHVEKPSGN